MVDTYWNLTHYAHQEAEAARICVLRYEAMLPFTLAAIGDELIFESEADFAKAEQAADAAEAAYRATKGADHG